MPPRAIISRSPCAAWRQKARNRTGRAINTPRPTRLAPASRRPSGRTSLRALMFMFYLTPRRSAAAVLNSCSMRAQRASCLRCPRRQQQRLVRERVLTTQQAHDLRAVSWHSSRGGASPSGLHRPPAPASPQRSHDGRRASPAQWRTRSQTPVCRFGGQSRRQPDATASNQAAESRHRRGARRGEPATQLRLPDARRSANRQVDQRLKPSELGMGSPFIAL